MRSSLIATLLALCSILALFAPALTAAPEDEEIPALTIELDKEFYQLGEQVNITVTVTANGIIVDPDAPGVVMAILMNWTMGEEPGAIEWLVSEKVTKGVYAANFTITEDHITLFEPMEEGLPLTGRCVAFMAMAEHRGVRAMQLGLIWMETGPGMSVSISNPSPSPGQTVTVTVTTYNQTLIDAQDVRVGLDSYDGETVQDLDMLTVTRESLGTYKASYTVPVDLAVSTDYRVKAAASFPDYNHSRYLTPLFDQTFSVRFFDVWGQNVSMTDEGTELAIWVADPTGAAVEGALVDVTFNVTRSGEPPVTTELENTTGADGGAGFSLAPIQSGDRLDMAGVVSHGGLSQRVFQEGIVEEFVPDVGQPDDAGDFTMEAWSRNENVPFWMQVHMPGDSYTQRYRAYNDSGPIPLKRVNWYVIDRASLADTSYEVVESGWGVTDANGDMDVTFTVPPKDVNAWLMFEMNAWEYDEGQGKYSLVRKEASEPLVDAGIFIVNEDIELTVNRVHKEAPVELRAHMVLPRNSFIGYMMAVTDKGDEMTRWGQMWTLGPENDDFNLGPIRKVGPDLYGTDIQLPEFVPEDQTYNLVLLTVDLDAFRIEANYVSLDYGESTTKGVEATLAEAPDPVHAGEGASLRLLVDNTGMGDDEYTWTATSDAIELPIAGGVVDVPLDGQAEVVIPVQAPADLDEGTYDVTVTFASKDPTANDTVIVPLQVVVNGVELEVDAVETTAVRGDVVTLVFTATNTGQGPDTFTVAMDGTALPWATIDATTAADVPEDGTVDFTVTVTVPTTADEDVHTLSLTATSSDGVTNATAEATVSVLVNGVEVSANPTLVEAWRSEDVNVTIEVTNTGQGEDTYAMDYEAPAGWTVTGPATFVVDEGATGTIVLTVTAPAGADEADYTVNVTATSSDGVVNATASFVVQVWVSGIVLVPEEATMKGYRSGQVVFTLNLTNTGQGDDVYDLAVQSVPWVTTATFGSDPVSVGEGGSVEVTLTVGLTATLDAGDYELNVTATSQDGRTMATVKLTVRVLVKGVQATIDQTSTKVTRGKEVELTLTVKNTGQGTDTFTVLLSGPASGWCTADTTLFDVAEGATGTVVILIAPPKNATVGISILNITVLSSEASFLDRAQVEVKVDKPKESPAFGAPALAFAVALATFAAMTTRRRRA